MNEVTQIHLGRQAFTISVGAHQALRAYLDAIVKVVSDQSVAEEVELRMAELLSEHGISGEKVILPADVDFLKEQLGDPRDFKDDNPTLDDEEAEVDEPTRNKRLFRDTDNAQLAGVAAGIGRYLGVDAVLVRIGFILLVFAGGWGILLYLVLWLTIPAAKTASDRLKMDGKPVNIGSLREVAERADVKGAAQRANATLAGPINGLLRTVIKIIGFTFVLAGLFGLFGLLLTAVYLALDSHQVLDSSLFPIGITEHLLLYSALLTAGLLSLFIVLFGMAIFRHKWPLGGLITGLLVGLIFINLAVGGALAGDAAPHIRDRYNANTHSVSYTMPAFSKIDTNENRGFVIINYQAGSNYSVRYQYYGNPDLSNIKTTVKDGTLTIDTRNFDNTRHCDSFCLPNTYNMQITVTAPNMSDIENINFKPAENPPPDAPDSPFAPKLQTN
ncbi:MAG: rane protein of unknown function [Candidatus Saccharibacteria bacterium]|nr:rane protein of unknown function [Candidatus Saccharibacteria bacterium]